MKYQIHKSMLIWMLAATAFVGMPQVNAALIIEAEGIVDPGAGMVTDNMDATSTFGGTSTFSQIDYLFRVTYADLPVNYLKLEFEDDVFQSLGPVTNFNPGDWSIASSSYSSGSRYEIATGVTPITAGGTLSFSVTNVVVFNDALSDKNLWQEGHFWAQSFVAAYSIGIYQGEHALIAPDGGSTAKVSEPPSLVLLGLGLLGLGFGLRHRKLN